jgi:hypothetical protein
MFGTDLALHPIEENLDAWLDDDGKMAIKDSSTGVKTGSSVRPAMQANDKKRDQTL